MFITIETHDGATALINPAHITHVLPSDTAYAEEGSVIHFVSDRAIQVKAEVDAVTRLLKGAGADLSGGTGGKPFLISS